MQARVSSTRLPRKVLAPVGRVSLIERLLSQLRGARSLSQVVVATSSDPSDDELAERLSALGYSVFRGSLDDVLARFGAAAREYQADVVVRLTGDCPLHTPDTVDEVVEAFLAAGVDYATNTEPLTRPDGLDVEVFTRAALERAVAEARAAPDREHVTPYLRRADGLKRLFHRHRGNGDAAGLRWTVDEPPDLDYVRRVWVRLDQLGPGPHDYETIMRATQDLDVKSPADIPNRGYYKSLFDDAKGEKAQPLPLAQSEAMLAMRMLRALSW